MSKWFCSIKPAQDPFVVIVETEDDGPALATLVVDAEMAPDAKRFAWITLARMAKEKDGSSLATLIVHQTGEDAVADYSVRWVDGPESGSRRMQFRKCGGRGWKDWNDSSSEAA